MPSFVHPNPILAGHLAGDVLGEQRQKTQRGLKPGGVAPGEEEADPLPSGPGATKKESVPIIKRSA